MSGAVETIGQEIGHQWSSYDLLIDQANRVWFEARQLADWIGNPQSEGLMARALEESNALPVYGLDPDNPQNVATLEDEARASLTVWQGALERLRALAGQDRQA